MKLPVLISVPHAGVAIPPELEAYNILSEEDIRHDGDEGAAEIYAVQSYFKGYIASETGRAFVDLNRDPGDRTKDGVVKTYTCWDVPIYKEPLTEKMINLLLDKYYHPYHQQLNQLSKGLILGIDCHTMADTAPPIAADAGNKRPLVCPSNAEGTCPENWLKFMQKCFENAFQSNVAINQPFKGGYIIRRHSKEMPWIQVEISRTSDINNTIKKDRFLDAVNHFISQI